MELQPVKSSNIACVEYMAPYRVMLIQYHDGSLYARLDVSPEQYVAFNAAPSKGGFAAAMPNKAILISKGSRKEDAAIELTEHGVVEGKAAAPLNVLDEEADPCCRKAFKQPAGCGWTCPDCGTDFASEMVGPVRHWRVKAWVSVLRPQR